MTMPAYTEDGKEYSSWEALIKGETNGWITTVVMKENNKRGLIFTWSVGPFDTKREANNAKTRLRTKFNRSKKERSNPPELLTISVRPLWKKV